MYKLSIPMATALIFASATGPVVAESIEFTFEGTIEAALGTFSAPFGSVAVGDSYTFRYVFDSTTADTDPDPALGAYLGAIQSFELSIGAASVMGVPIVGLIGVEDESTPGLERYEAAVGTSAFIFGVSMNLTPGTLPSDALPTALDPGTFSDFQFAIFDPSTEASAAGNLTAFTGGDGGDDETAVPAASAWTLVIMTLLLLVGAKIRFGRPRSGSAVGSPV